MPTYNAVKVTSNTTQMPGVGDGQSAKCIATTFTYAAAPAAADVIIGPLIQAGSVITDVCVLNGIGAVITAGPATAPAYHIAAGSGAVPRMNVANAPMVMASNTTINATITSGGAAGFITIIVWFLPLNA